MPSSLNSRFAALDDDLAAPTVVIEESPYDFSSHTAQSLELRLDQLEVIPQDTLYSQFVLDTDDPQIVSYANSLKTMGDLADHITVWPTGRVKCIGALRLRIYQVIHDPYQYAAYTIAKRHDDVVWCDIPAASDIGEALLARLSTRQHQRPQSLLEKADLVKHLRDDLGKTNAQIIAHLTFSSEDGDPPSDAYVSQLYAIACLPKEVRRDIHRGILLFSHARELCRLGDDENLCILFSMLATQDSERMAVTTLNGRITEVLAGRYEILLQANGRVVCRPKGALSLVSDRGRSAGRATMFYTQTWAAAEPQIARYAKQFRPNIMLVPGNTPSQTAITPQSLGGLISQINALKGNTPLPVVEALLIGYVEAAHRAAEEGGFTNSQGLLAPETEASTQSA